MGAMEALARGPGRQMKAAPTGGESGHGAARPEVRNSKSTNLPMDKSPSQVASLDDQRANPTQGLRGYCSLFQQT
jgi:hypothetical protein